MPVCKMVSVDYLNRTGKQGALIGILFILFSSYTFGTLNLLKRWYNNAFKLSGVAGSYKKEVLIKRWYNGSLSELLFS